MDKFKADGFIGFYSTIASSGLTDTLKRLKNDNKIKDFKIIDGKEIENHLITTGYSSLLMRYFPNSYKNIKPLHLFLDNYDPLYCKYCGKDLLLESFTSNAIANLISVHDKDINNNKIIDVYCVCAGECDQTLKSKYESRGYMTSYQRLSNFFIPLEYLSAILTTMNDIYDNLYNYSNDAYKKLKSIYIKLAKKNFRYITEEERNYVKKLRSLPFR